VTGRRCVSAGPSLRNVHHTERRRPGFAHVGELELAPDHHLDKKMAPVKGPFLYYIFLSISGFFIIVW
jgi:hypothetical protein